MPKSPWEITQAWWNEIRLKVKHGVVYMDAQMAELLHWSGGMDILLSAGATDLREFSSFESADESCKKGVFIVSSPLRDVVEEIVHDVVTQSQFQYVIVMTTVSPILHTDSMDDEGNSVFEDFEEKILEWMGNMNFTAEVLHMPLFCAEVCPGLVIAPAFSQLFPFLDSDVKQITHQYSSTHATKDPKVIRSLEDVELHHLPESLQLQVKLLASGLHALLQGLDVREDIYSLGHMGRLVATQLDSYPPARSRRKAVQNRASLVLVDRTLDIGSAVTHQWDTLMDRVMNTLTHLEGHSSDRQVDLTDLTYRDRNKCVSPSVLLSGSLAPTQHSTQPSHLLDLITRKHKEAVMDVNRKLVETASADKLPLNLSARPGRVTAEQLDTTLALYKGNYPLIRKHLDLLQVAKATSQALRHPSATRHDATVATEKNLVQTLAEDDARLPSGFSILSKLVVQEMNKPRDERTLTVDDILGLTAYLYAVSDGQCGEEEDAEMLRQEICDWIKLDKDNLSDLMKQIVGDQVTESILSDQIESVWDKLMAVGQARDGLQQLKSVLDPGDAMTPASVKPILRQLMEQVLDPAKPELLDVECKSGGLKDLLKSGFGFFKSSSKPRLGDAPLLMVFVIGGITTSEVKQIRDLVDKAKAPFEVLVGSTRLCSITSTLESLLATDNINLATL